MVLCLMFYFLAACCMQWLFSWFIDNYPTVVNAYRCCRVADLESAEDLYQRRITRILTTDFPKYFAVVTRIRHDTALLGPDGGLMTSKVNTQVQAVFPPTALTKPIKVGLQVIKT